ncbi:MAG: hypothetical protein ACKO55_09570, partial [Bacteroidota bacterium]
MAGICPGYLPQYFTSAMFDGHSQPSSPEEIIMDSEWDNDIVENSLGTLIKKEILIIMLKQRYFIKNITDDEG